MDDLLATWSPTETLRGDESSEEEPSTTQSLPLLPGLAGAVDKLELSVGGLLGVGGMGEVYVATQHSLEREVAVKRVVPAKASAVSALLREARVAGRLEHPGVVPVHALGWTEEGPALVMKRIEGAPWSELIADPHRGPWRGREGDPMEWHLEVLAEVCHALELAHSRGVLHRDIKPDNVMVGAFGEVYLLDWGIAWLLDGPDGSQGSTRLVGTPAYMAPEMARGGGRDLGVHTDVFLLGATLHHVLTGRPRYSEESAGEAVAQAAEAAPFPYGPQVPSDLAAIANRACARDPGERFADVASFRAALLRHRAHRGSLAASRMADAELQTLQSLLEGPADPMQVHRRWSACRFGYAQALREWPENSQAREGLAMAAELVVAFELARGDAGAAGAILAELDAPDPKLQEQVQLAARERDQLLAEGARMLELQDELRVAGLDWGRSVATLVSGGVALAMLVAFGVALRANGMQADGSGFALASAVGLGVNVVGLVIFRRALLDNRAYLRLMVVLLVLWLMGVALGLGGLLVGVGWPALLLGGCMVITGVCATLAVTFDGLFFGSTLLALLFSALALSVPRYGADLVGLGYLVHSVWFAWALRPRNRPPPASGPAAWRDRG